MKVCETGQCTDVATHFCVSSCVNQRGSAIRMFGKFQWIPIYSLVLAVYHLTDIFGPFHECGEIHKMEFQHSIVLIRMAINLSWTKKSVFPTFLIIYEYVHCAWKSDVDANVANGHSCNIERERQCKFFVVQCTTIENIQLSNILQ